MEEKNIIKIKLSTAICISVIITMLVILVVFLGVNYLKKYKEDENSIGSNKDQIKVEDSEEDKTIISKEEVDKEDKIEQLNIKIDLVQKLYKYIPVADFIADENDQPMKTAYQSKKVKINDLDNNIKLINTFKNLELNEENKTYIEGDWYYFASELLENRALEIYGENVNITNESFNITWGASCSYENDRYMYSDGGGGFIIDSIREIQEAYIEDDILYILDKFMLGMDITAEDSNGATFGESYNLYANTKADKLIGKEDTWQEKSALIKKYSDKMTEYKHTFKKGANGEYYWYSSEPII